LEWRKKLKYDPVIPLMESGNNAVLYFTGRDLLHKPVSSISTIWNLKHPQGILRKQQPDGYWKYPGKNEDYYLLETFKNLQSLIHLYEFNRTHPAIATGCEYLFSYQTDEGDMRGFIGNQYAPYYTGIVTALLIRAGYEDDPRILKALDWLLSVRQNDGGWVIGSPGLSGIPNLKWNDIIYLTSDKNAPVLKAFDKTKPFSHSGTGMVIRAFAAHGQYRQTPEILKAARLLKSHLFKEDNYSSYKHKDNWLRFQFPFWWNNLIAALDSLSLTGIQPTDADIKIALDWLISNQQENGLWEISYSKIHKASINKKTDEQKLWVTLAICRVFKRFYG
jgi:hypothetical protein